MLIKLLDNKNLNNINTDFFPRFGAIIYVLDVEHTIGYKLYSVNDIL